jgi:putative sporulation protein YtaF
VLLVLVTVLGILALSAAASVDAIGLGISLGVRKIKIGLGAMFMMSFTGFIIVIPSLLAGVWLREAVGSKMSGIISGAVLVFMGLWIILQSRQGDKPTESRTVKIMREPKAGDIDGSGSIDCIEAIFIGVAISVDSVGISMGVGGTMDFAEIFPLVAMTMQLACVVLGVRIGKTVGEHLNTHVCTLLSGVVVLLMGVINIIGG